MADRGLDLSGLPKDVRDQLAELDLELSEGKVGLEYKGKGEKIRLSDKLYMRVHTIFSDSS